ncbi:MAG: hypothetical protein R2712_18395 [Vicinamibacterales bacterium]
MPRRKPTLAVWKFASCDGCQLSLLDLEDELLAVAGAFDIAYFREASSRDAEGPFDISIADGSITTAHDLARLRDVRARSRYLVALGACATSGGIQVRATSPTSRPTRAAWSTPRLALPDAGDLHRLLGSRHGGLRAARVPDRQAPASRGAERLPARPHARPCRRTVRLHGMQDARDRVRDGHGRRAWDR